MVGFILKTLVVGMLLPSASVDALKIRDAFNLEDGSTTPGKYETFTLEDSLVGANTHIKFKFKLIDEDDNDVDIKKGNCFLIKMKPSEDAYY